MTNYRHFPELSVVVPVYNAEPYLRRCLDSIVNQNHSVFEVILINDGSSDMSGMICDKYAERYDFVKCIHQKNSGVNIARKVGIESAKGKYVTFVDADDEIPDNTISLYVSELGGGYDVVRGRSLLINESTGYSFQENYPLSHGVIDNNSDYMRAIYMGETPTYLCGGAYRRDLFQSDVFENNANNNINYSEDWVTNLFIGLNIKRVKYLDRITYHYYVVHSSITHTVTTSVSYIDKLDRVLEEKGVFKINALATERSFHLSVNYLALLFKPEQQFSMKCYRYVKNFVSQPDNYQRIKKRTKASYLYCIKCLPAFYCYTCIYRFLYLWKKQGGKKRRVIY